MAALSQRKPAFDGTHQDSCRAKGRDKTDTLWFCRRAVNYWRFLSVEWDGRVTEDIRPASNIVISFPLSWKERDFASSMICSLIPTGSDLPPLNPVRRPQAPDCGVPSRTHRPGEAFHHPRRDWPHQPQSPAVARLPARRGLLQLTLCSGKCMVKAKIILGLSSQEVVVVQCLGRSERAWLIMSSLIHQFLSYGMIWTSGWESVTLSHALSELTRWRIHRTNGFGRNRTLCLRKQLRVYWQTYYGGFFITCRIFIQLLNSVMENST
jgi:hypothetical protein